MKFKLTVMAWLVVAVLSAQTSKPLVQVAVTDISCAGQTDGQIELTLTSGSLPVSFQWVNLNSGALGIGQFTSLNQPLLLTGLAHGLYRFHFVDANNLDTVLQRVLLNPPPLQGQIALLSKFGAYQLSCAQGNDGEVLLEITGGTLPLTFNWSNGDKGIRADSLPAGPVSVSVMDARGCLLQVDTQLLAPTPINTTLQVEGETCIGENSGSIAIETLGGGVPPYQFFLNTDPPGSQMIWQDLPHGQYFLNVRDAIGCVHTTGVILPSGIEFTLKLGADTSMLSGDTLLLTFYSDPPADTLIWKPAAGVQWISNKEVLLFPRFSTTYEVTAVSAIGCLAFDDISVTVSRDRETYVPNVFAPAAQNTGNGQFTVFGSPGIRTVELLQVFDRFGRLWFENKNFPVNDPDSGWNGTEGGDEAPVGVYVWRAVLRYTDGRQVQLQGDVTVIR